VKPLKKFQIIESDHHDAKGMIKAHIDSLAYPLDSWLEDRLLESVIYKLMDDGICIGYGGLLKETLHFFHVLQGYFRFAPVLLEKIVEEKEIKRVFIMTQDSLLSALMAEWDFDVERQACWFTASGREEPQAKKVGQGHFRTAQRGDGPRIRDVAGDFFDEPSGGFSSLEERIDQGTIFVFEDHEELLGCGIVEKGQFCGSCISIGMFVNREHRKKGVARTILLNLKEQAVLKGLRPVAGCWYYNTLSRKSLESAGMIATSIGYEAILKGKEALPLRTGNPPGELVDD
jgi:GNAT superfamily N-acetyltransferase